MEQQPAGEAVPSQELLSSVLVQVQVTSCPGGCLTQGLSSESFPQCSHGPRAKESGISTNRPFVFPRAV